MSPPSQPTFDGAEQRLKLLRKNHSRGLSTSPSALISIVFVRDPVVNRPTRPTHRGPPWGTGGRVGAGGRQRDCWASASRNRCRCTLPGYPPCTFRPRRCALSTGRRARGLNPGGDYKRLQMADHHWHRQWANRRGRSGKGESMIINSITPRNVCENHARMGSWWLRGDSRPTDSPRPGATAPEGNRPVTGASRPLIAIGYGGGYAARCAGFSLVHRQRVRRRARYCLIGDAVPMVATTSRTGLGSPRRRVRHHGAAT